jgi:tetratricopeptide (TPR) repeat protein
MAERESTFTQHAKRVLEQGKPREALQVLQSWLPLNPDDAGAWDVAREAHLELGELSEAEHAAREVARLRPESAEAWSDLGVVLGKQGKADEARKALHQALSIDPSFEGAQALLEKPKERATEPPPARDGQQAPTEPTREKGAQAAAASPPATKRQPPPPPPAEEKPPPEPPAEEPPARRPAQKKRGQEQQGETEVGWYGEPLQRKTEGWKVRSPEGEVYGPYTESQLSEHLLEGSIHQSWGARYGSGRVTTVREALGAERCNELQRQRREQQVQQQASQLPAQQTEVASTIRCPHCGQWTVTAEKKSASNARLAIILLGLLLWPLWFLLLVVKDKTQYSCASCGMQWTSEA